MPSITRAKVIALGCVMSGLLATAGDAQVATGSAVSSEFLHTGLFLVQAGGQARFNVALEGTRGGSSAKALLQIVDQAGTEIARSDVALGPGQATTLRVDGPGLFRGNVKITRSSSTSLPNQPSVFTSVEIDDPIVATRVHCTVNPSGKVLNTGPFSVPPGGSANFYLSLNERRGGAPAKVLLQFFDRSGNEIARRETVLAAGQSTTLSMARSGLYTGHAEFADPVGLPFSAERAVVGGADVHDTLVGVIRPVCTPDPVGVRPPP